MIANDSFPLRHLHRMYLIFSGNLPDRFDAHQRFQSNLGLEGTCVPLALSSFAHGSAVLSSPAEPEKSNLDHCPNFGVHFMERKRCREEKAARKEKAKSGSVGFEGD